MRKQVNYNFYATLLDGYQNYLSSSEIYDKYWGFSEEPPFTEDEFKEQQFQSLIDRINRVPFESEAAEQGTVFNELIDCLIENRKPAEDSGMIFETDRESGMINTRYVKSPELIYNFPFPLPLCLEFANYFKGALTQVRTEAVLPTKYGNVLLYGYIDELMPVSVHDIKTTKSYTVGNFKNHWQHIVYPYCLNENGNKVNDFEYNVAEINRTKYAVNYNTFTEHYSYNPEIDLPKLTAHVEGLIEFIEYNKHLITDQKIFNNGNPI
ncbi:MAG: HNH endonuclease [Paludibacteraceae bacterium]